MDHLSAMLHGNLDDLFLGQIGAYKNVLVGYSPTRGGGPGKHTNWGVLSTLANDICLVGLCGIALVSGSGLG